MWVGDFWQPRPPTPPYPHRSSPPPLTCLVHRVQEVAGLGGDVSYVKAQGNVLGAVSWRRFAPDTGFALPLHRAAWLAAAAGSSKRTVPDDAMGPDGRPLRPHPGLDVLSLTAPSDRGAGASGRSDVGGSTVPTSPALTPSPSESDLSPLQRAALFLREEHGVVATGARSPTVTRAVAPSGSPAFAPPAGSYGSHDPTPSGSGVPAAPTGSAADTTEYTGWHRLAGWMSPGVTLQGEVTLGAMASYGSDAGHYAGARGVDRFYLTGYRMRGYELVGGKARRVEHGTPFGDALGGTTIAAATARLLLPPPFPSVRIANAGMRTHLYASVGRVGGMPASARELIDTLSASAGVGVVGRLR